MYVGT